MSWPEFGRLPPDRSVALLPLGALEAHGPHLPLGTDIVIAEAMARAGAERLSSRGMEVVLLPTLPVAQHLSRLPLLAPLILQQPQRRRSSSALLGVCCVMACA